MTKQPKIAGFALVDDFNGDVFRNIGTCFYEQNIIPIVIGLKKGRNVVDKDRSIKTEIDLTFNRARSQIDCLVLADDISVEQLKDHGPFVKLIEQMMKNNQPIVVFGGASLLLAKLGLLKGRKISADPKITEKLKKAGAVIENEEVTLDENLLSIKAISELPIVCNNLINILKKAA